MKLDGIRLQGRINDYAPKYSKCHHCKYWNEIGYVHCCDYMYDTGHARIKLENDCGSYTEGEPKRQKPYTKKRRK